MDKSLLIAQKIQQRIHRNCLKKGVRKAEATGELVPKRMAEKITKAALKNTREYPRKLTVSTKIDESSKQPIGISREK